MSWAVTRTRLPARRTLPSRMLVTRSASPMRTRSSALPLKAKEEVRAGTRRPGICARAFRISSERPSEKYALPGSSLRLRKGSTATEGGLEGAAGPGTAMAATERAGARKAR